MANLALPFADHTKQRGCPHSSAAPGDNEQKSSTSVERILQILRCCELGNPRRLEHHLKSCLRIASLAGLAISHLERPETRDAHFLAILHGLLDMLDHRLDCDASLVLG